MKMHFCVLAASMVFPLSAAMGNETTPIASDSLPPAMTSALHNFSTNAVDGKFRALKKQNSSSLSLCSVPLAEPPQWHKKAVMDRMPVPKPNYHADQNQVSPPAPPCPHSNR